MKHLTVIDGSPPPDTPKQRVIDRIKAHAKPDAVVSCHRCGGREVLELRAGAVLRNGKLTGGTRIVVCACCHRKGERVVLA